ncbi:phage capsid protein [Roseomonas sp. GC11]|uniref:phage capsid protein n=1 Tax=Roseomonas sp. GC11 TaxID=2950546 RepID=UPI00210D5C2F|nr:phage capsid protein [Roseomonas sp. GC11]MCQ4158762.1 phage capsid protein [Roseomonas sp. GC11]
MSNATPSRLGQINGTGDALALFLKVFSGEVMSAFERATVFRTRTMVRTIASGKSAQFPIVGRATASYHTPGNEILGTAVPQNEVVLTVDDMLISPQFIAEIDEAMNHYDLRSYYSTEGGRALARTFDANLAQTGVLAARTAALLTDAVQGAGGGEAGDSVTDANMGTSGSALAAAAFSAQQKFDEKDVPQDDRTMYVRPAQYYLLAQTTSVLNKDWGGSGAYADGTVLRVAGLEIVKTNSLPITNITTGPSKYQGNFTNTRALFMHKAAVGTVELIGISSRADYDPRRLGTLLNSKMAIGHGVLRPVLSIEGKTA